MAAPKHLSPAAKRHWRRIASQYELTGDAELLLCAALESWDTSRAARELVERDGIILESGKKNPAIEIELRSRASFGNLMRQLGLDIVEPGDSHRRVEH